MKTYWKAKIGFAGGDLSKTVEGRHGTFKIDHQDDGQWSVEYISSNKDEITGSTYVGAFLTAREALADARERAGLPKFEKVGLGSNPLPDRRGLVAHTRAKS